MLFFFLEINVNVIIFCGKKIKNDSKFCKFCGKEIVSQTDDKLNQDEENSLIKCPNCGADVPEYARAILHKESTEAQMQQEASIRQKRNKYVRLSLIVAAVGILVIFPVTLYFGLMNKWYWLPIVSMLLWLLVMIYLGWGKGAALCPFCHSPVGRTMGKYCPHCRKQFRD